MEANKTFFVRCVYGKINTLTSNTYYKVKEVGNNFYVIKNDKGRTIGYGKWRFQKVDISPIEYYLQQAKKRLENVKP